MMKTMQLKTWICVVVVHCFHKVYIKHKKQYFSKIDHMVTASATFFLILRASSQHPTELQRYTEIH